MKRLTAILSLLVLCLLPFVSPYLFGKGMRFSSNHQKNLQSALKFVGIQRSTTQSIVMAVNKN